MGPKTQIIVVLTRRSAYDPGVMHGKRKSSFDFLRRLPLGAVGRGCRTGAATWLILLAAAAAPASEPEGAAVPVRAVRSGAGWTLERGGQPFFIKGAVGDVRLELLAASGANSIRGGARSLESAARQGLTVLVGLPFGNPRQGFDYGDPVRVEPQFARIREMVNRWKNHPAVLMWAIGNEPEIHTTEAVRAPVWREINRIARMIHEVDPAHPVIAVIGGEFRQVLHEANAACPDLDAIGLNAYADMLTLPEDVAREGWTRPYVVTEFGPRGHWQVPKAAWRVPIEDTSTEKAAFYARAYAHAVRGRAQCLGSYVFYWNQKQEKTHTWYGLFLPDGSRTGAIDTMTFLWSGAWPTNRCPEIGRIRLSGGEDATPRATGVYPPGTELQVDVDCRDPEQEALRITWELRQDVADNPNVGGDPEASTPPIEGAVLRAEGEAARIRLPDQGGNYRVFVYAYDPHGGAATANDPVRVEAP